MHLQIDRMTYDGLIFPLSGTRPLHLVPDHGPGRKSVKLSASVRKDETIQAVSLPIYIA